MDENSAEIANTKSDGARYDFFYFKARPSIDTLDSLKRYSEAFRFE